jgi:hypothetical protein
MQYFIHIEVKTKEDNHSTPEQTYAAIASSILWEVHGIESVGLTEIEEDSDE